MKITTWKINPDAKNGYWRSYGTWKDLYFNGYGQTQEEAKKMIWDQVIERHKDLELLLKENGYIHN